MSQQKIRRTIKRLLRLAKRGEGAEAENARRRADELMAKHGIVVDPNEPDEVRVPVKVTDAFWHRWLLGTIVKAYECRIVRKRDSDDFAVLGEDKAPEEAVQKFESVTNQIWRRCTDEWRRAQPAAVAFNAFDEARILLGLTPKNDTGLPSKAQIAKLEQVYRGAFLNTAAETVANEIRPGAIMRQPIPEAGQKAGPEYLMELQRMKGLAKEAAKEQRSVVQDLIDRASRDGKACVYEIDWTIRSGLLASASSFLAPPPPPSRYNQLDLDEE